MDEREGGRPLAEVSAFWWRKEEGELIIAIHLLCDLVCRDE